MKQEVTSATLGQALCAAEAERDKLKSGLGHIQVRMLATWTFFLVGCQEIPVALSFSLDSSLFHSDERCCL